MSGPIKGQGPLLNTEPTNTTSGGRNGWTVIHPSTAYGGSSVNSWSSAQSVGFPFSFYGSSATHFCVSKNYLLTFDTTVVGTTVNSSITTDNTALPHANLPDHTIAYFWGGFSPPLGGGDDVQMKTFGTIPNRQLWIKNFSYKHEAQSFSYNFVVLEETTHKIYVVDAQFGNQGVGSYTVGVQLNSTTAIQHPNSPNISSINAGSYTPWPNVDYYEFTPRYNFNLLGCPAPSSSVASLITQTGARLFWTKGRASNWDLEYGLSGFTLGSGTFVYNVSNPYTLNHLTPGTDYDFYVRDSCGRGNVSSWAGPGTFTTSTTLPCPAPSSSVASLITQTGARLFWARGRASNWDLEYGLSGFTLGSGTFVYNVSNPYTLNRLTPGTDYDFYVRDSCGRGNVSSWAGPQNFRTLSCPSPSSLLATHITQTSAELSWVSGGAFNWNIEYGLSGFTLGSGTFVYNVSNPYTLNRLTPGTDYDFYVRDSCGRGNVSSWAGPQNFRTLSCPSPSSLLATHITQTSAELSWVSGGAFNWNIEYGLSGFTLGSGTFVYNVSNPSYTVSGLTSGQSYQFYVRDSCGGSNVSTWSGPQNFRTLSCPSPSSLLATHITQISAELSWVSGGASNWNIEYGFSGFTLGSGTRISTTTPSYTVSGLTSGQSYQFYVRDSCGGGNVSTWAGPQNFRTLSCPSPSSLLATHITQTSAELSWVGGGAFNWDLEYGFSGFTLGSGTFVYNVSNPSYTVSGLTSGQSYQFYVRDSCGGGNVSTWAGPQNFRTLSCPSPSSLLATHITQTSAELSWINGGASNWNIEYGFSGFTLGSGTFVYNVSNPYTLNRLTAGTTYDFYVRDSCGGGNVSTWAGPQNFRTLSCPSPSSLLATHITQISAELSWVSGGASNWDLEYGLSGFILGSGTRISTTTPSYTVSGLTSGQSYQFYVRDSCGGGNVSTWAGPQNFRTLSCPSPSSLLATHITQTSAELSWINGGASNWNIEYGFSGFTLGSGTFVYNVSNPYTLNRLTAGTTYDFYVRDSCGGGNVSTWAGPQNFRTLSCPSPSSLLATHITQISAELSWVSGGASNWDLEYGLSGFILGSGTRISTTTPSYTVSGLTSGQSYQFYVRDSCGGGNVSTWAGPQNFRTLSCPFPLSLLATHITQTSAELSWISGGASNWDLEYGFSGFILGSGTFVYNVSNPYTLNRLTPGTDYDFYVRDSCGGGNVSTWAGPQNFRTLSCPFPLSLLATHITQTSAELSWISGGASNWDLEYGFSGFILGSGTFVYNVSNPYTLNRLTPGTDYDFYVRDSCGGGNVSTWAGPQNFRTLSCPSPSSLLATHITQTSAELSWISGGASNWDLEYGFSGFILGSGTFVYNVSNPSYTVSGLTSGQSYQFYVRDSCGGGNVSTWAGPQNFRTLSCPSPSSLLATHITQTSAELSWVSGGAFNWNIEYGFSGFTLGSGTFVYNVSNPSYTVSGLTSGQSYQFYVRDSCGGGNVSTWAGPQNFRTLSCPSPSSLLATHITQTSAELSWISGGASNWDLEYGFSGFTLGSGTFVYNVSNPYTLNRLTAGTTYDFYVRDSCGVGHVSSWAGPDTFTTLSATLPCPSPSSLLATHITQTSAELSWVSGGAFNWNIEWGFSGFTLGSGTRISTTTPSYTVSGLISGQSYQFYVRDSCGRGNVSTWAGPQNFRTLSCPFPLSLLATHITQTSAELSWVSGGASNWNIEWGFSGFTLGSGTRISTTTPSYTVSGLTSGQSYQFYVRDSCGGGNVSTWAGPQNFRTLSCPSPSSLLATHITQTSAELSWVGGGAFNWNIEYGFSGFTLGSGTRISTTTPSYTVSGLTSGQSYQFYVRDSCGGGNVSTWAGPQNFRTLSCPSPSSLLVTHITQTSAELSWVSGGASNWDLEYGFSGFILGSGTRISTTTPSYTVSGLTSGQSYQFYVRDSCGGGNVSTWAGPQNFRTLSCPSPSSLLATHITQTSAELSWVGGGAFNWNIEYGFSGFTLGSGTRISTTTPSYTVSGLTSGQSYQFYVRDSCGGGNVSTWAGPQNFRTLSCPSPSSLLATHITQTSAELSWVGGGAFNWNIEYGFSGFTLGSGTRISTTTPSYTVSGLTSGQSYQFYVRDSCGGGNVSTWAGPQNFRTLSCPSPSSLLVTHITQTSAELSWVSGGASNWDLEYGFSGFILGSGTRISTTTPSYTVSGLTSGQSYQFYVRDSCGGGNVSTWAGPQNFRTLSCPSPSSLLATHITQTSAELSWISGGASNWDLEYGFSGFTLGSGTFVYNVSNPYILIRLTAGTDYDFYVRDSCGVGHVSSWAGPDTFTTLSATLPCPSPSSLLATHITQTSAELSWVSGGAFNWNIEYGLSGFTLGSGTFVYNVSNPYILIRLTAGTTYDFYVRDSCGGGNVSTWAGPQNFRTLSCPSPSSLLATHITQTSAELSWVGGGAFNWNIEYGFSGFILGSGTRISTTTPSYTVSGLTSGQSYQFYVRDSCGGGNVSTWAGPQNFRTLSCPSPSSLLVTHITQTSAELSWVSGGASNWDLEYGFSGFILGSGTRISTTTPSYTVSGLTSGQSYQFYVRDSCGGGNVSTWAGPQNFRTLSCPSPSSLLATHITQTSAELSWISGGASNWDLEYGFSGFTLGSGTFVYNVSNPYILIRLTAGTTYDFYVRDSCGGGNVSTWAGPQNFRTLSCPSPSSLLATHITQTSAELSWISGGASNWNIEYGLSGFTLGSGTRISTTTPFYTVSGLTSGQSYQFYVRDSCGVGYVSSWAGPGTFTTLSVTLPCPSPSSLLATQITQTSARLWWMSGGISTFNWDLEYGLSGFTLGSGTRISTTTPFYTVSGLTAGRSYQFYVRDSCGVGYVSSWAGPHTFRTLGCLALAPTGLKLDTITEIIATVSWTSGGASNWNIEYGLINFPLGSGIFLYNMSSPRTLRGLRPSIFYDVYVQDSCNVGNVSNWMGPLSIKTLSIKTFIGIDELLERSLRIYPNPSEGVFKLEFSSSLGEDMEIRITNMMGQIVLEDEIESFSGSYRKRLEMGAYRSGVYLLQLITEKATVNRRIILQ